MSDLPLPQPKQFHTNRLTSACLLYTSKGERGVPLTVNVPYGYVKDPENPKHWLVDPEAAAIVKCILSLIHIFDRENAALTAAGQPPRQKKFETVKDTLRKQIGRAHV